VELSHKGGCPISRGMTLPNYMETVCSFQLYVSSCRLIDTFSSHHPRPQKRSLPCSVNPLRFSTLPAHLFLPSSTFPAELEVLLVRHLATGPPEEAAELIKREFAQLDEEGETGELDSTSFRVLPIYRILSKWIQGRAGGEADILTS